MSNNSIDTAVDGFIITVTKDGQRDAHRAFYAGSENEVRSHVNRVFPEGPYFTECKPVKKLSPGVYCAVNK